MNADGSGLRQLTNAPGYDGGPFISPDGKWVVFRSDRKKAEFLQIYAIGIDGKNEMALTDNIGVNWAPYWHPEQALYHLDRRRPFRSQRPAELRSVADEVRRARTARFVPAPDHAHHRSSPAPTCCRSSRPTAKS